MSGNSKNKEQIRAKAVSQLGSNELRSQVAKKGQGSAKVQSITILHVDDEPTFIEFTIAVLPPSRYKVLGAGSVSEAIDLLRYNSAISLILCEISMPDQSGFVLLDFLKKNTHLQKIPIVICSDLVQSDVVQKAHAMGVSGYLAKPYSKELLLEKIESILERQKISIMIVSNDCIVSKVLRQSFERKKCQTFAVASSSEAMQTLSENQIDVIITDLVLVDGTGPELLAQIRKSNNSIPIFFLDDQSSKIAEARVISLGANGIIRRPLNGSEIYRKTTAAIIGK